MQLFNKLLLQPAKVGRIPYQLPRHGVAGKAMVVSDQPVRVVATDEHGTSFAASEANTQHELQLNFPVTMYPGSPWFLVIYNRNDKDTIVHYAVELALAWGGSSGASGPVGP